MNVIPFSASKSLLIGSLDNFLQVVIRVVNRLFCGKFACLRLTAGAVLIALIASFPDYYAHLNNGLRQEFQMVTLAALALKVEHPLTPIPDEFKDVRLYAGSASHIDKLELRLTVPILGWLSGTGKWTVIIWNHLSALGVFYLLAYLATKAIGDGVSGALFVLGMGATFFGSWFFNDLYFGDGVAFLCLLLAVASRYPLFSFCATVAAAFCDERCVLAAPILCLYFVVSLREDAEKALRLKQCAAIAIGVIVWWSLRTWISGAFHLLPGTSRLMTVEILEENFTTSLTHKFLGVFNASWTLPAVGLLSLVSQRKWATSWFFAGALALAAAPAFLVDDFERSLCYTFIMLLVSAHFVWGDKEASRRYLATILVANVLLSSPLHSMLEIGKWLF